MSQYNIDKATTSSTATRLQTDYTYPAVNLDSPTGQKETEWMVKNAAVHYGYFISNPDLKSALLMKCVWVSGKGWTADARTTAYLNHITGWGKDTFNDIIFNLDVESRIYGDSFAEIIKDDQNPIINLKPLNPASMKWYVNEQGIITRYEQVNELEGVKQVKHFKKEEIFHLSHNRLGNQIHGISDIESLTDTLKADAEHFINLKKIMQQQVRPLLLMKLKTDVQSKIDLFVKNMDDALNKGDRFIAFPDDENILTVEPIITPLSEVVMTWESVVRNKFYRTIGLPQIVPGAGGNSTESESKVIYFAFEQIVKKEQLFLENQIRQQLNLDVKFIPPTSLLTDLATDTAKDAGGIGAELNSANKEEV